MSGNQSLQSLNLFSIVEQISICYIGTTLIKTKNGNVALKNTLCVPHLKMNLLSIQSMSRDLNCSFILNENSFKIHDNIIGNKLKLSFKYKVSNHNSIIRRNTHYWTDSISGG